ncbi:MAG TPA: hypothetical protein VGP64_18025 [Polyangia bacterium]|jgi:hypothetical protein
MQRLGGMTDPKQSVAPRPDYRAAREELKKEQAEIREKLLVLAELPKFQHVQLIVKAIELWMRAMETRVLILEKGA